MKSQEGAGDCDQGQKGCGQDGQGREGSQDDGGPQAQGCQGGIVTRGAHTTPWTKELHEGDSECHDGGAHTIVGQAAVHTSPAGLTV